MSRRATALIGAATLLVACSSSPTSGTVTEKDHRAAYTFIQQNCIAQPRGGCIFVPTTIHQPECWRITVTDQNGESGGWCLEQAEWDRIRVGQHWQEGA